MFCTGTDVNRAELIEKAIITCLQAAIPELEISAFPDNPADYEFIHPLGAVLVQYDSSSFDDYQCLAFTAQKRTLRFNAVSIMRSLRSHCGCYAILDRIRRALLGLKIDGCEQIRQTDERFSDESDGIWTYTQTFSVVTTDIQDEQNYKAQDSFYS